MKIDAIEVPYDSGHHNRRMGSGVARLAEAAILPTLTPSGHDVRRHPVHTDSPMPAEIATAFELQRMTVKKVAAAIAANAFPLIVAGNCNIAALGGVAGLAGEDVAVLWLDAHAECETPETTESGFLDGMGIAMLIGECWRSLLSALPGFRPLPGNRVALIGARQISRAENALIQHRGIVHVSVDALRTAGLDDVLATCFDGCRKGGVKRLYVHVDLDVLDPTIAQANPYAEPGGMSLSEVGEAIAAARRFTIGAAAITAYDPACDPDGRMIPAASSIAGWLVSSASSFAPSHST